MSVDCQSCSGNVMSPIRKILWPGRAPRCDSCSAAVQLNPWISFLFSVFPVLVIMVLFITLEEPMPFALGVLALSMLGLYLLPFTERK